MTPARPPTPKPNREDRRRILNLDKSRQARAEKKGPPPEVVLAGKTFVLPASPPALAFLSMAEVQAGDLSQLRPAFSSLFGEDADKLLELGLDLDDLQEILDLYTEGEGSLGEGSDSGD